MNQTSDTPREPTIGGPSSADFSTWRLTTVISCTVIVLALLFAFFIESRDVYYADNQIYPSCQSSLVRDCMLLEDDSNRYLKMALEFDISDMAEILDTGGIISLGVLNNTLLYIVFQASQFLAPDFPYTIIILFNALMFLGGMRNMQAIAQRLSVDVRDMTILYCLNPLMLFAITSLNKEIFGIFLLSAAARAALYRKPLTLLLVLVFAMLTRFAFGAAILLFTLRYFFPIIRLKHTIVALCLGIPALVTILSGQLAGSNAPSFLEYAGSLEQRSATTLSFAAVFLFYPFGPIITWAIVGAVDVLSPVLNLPLYARYSEGFNLDLFAQQASSLLFGIFGAILIVRILQKRFVFTVGSEIFLYFFITVATLPISAHRYLIAGWPFLTLAVLEYANAAQLFSTRTSLIPMRAGTRP